MPVDDEDDILSAIHHPQISLTGQVNDQMVVSLIDQLRKVEAGHGLVAIEMTTLGGDADMARRLVVEIDLARQRLQSRRLIFLGKSLVYSAGVTVMSAFPLRDRFLLEGTMLLIHGRQMDKTVQLSGPVRENLAQLRALCHQIETGIHLEEEGFGRLIEHSRLSMDQLLEKALYNWYVPAEEALQLDLIGGVVDLSGQCRHH
ncbi:peptidase S14 [Altererythrobacter xixiisoli]|uniref:Peptidase S14 n=1 Tax=Croceibacterium xixiisoli TaxID=1476466 RepID=A0A6I4TS04_9SPHN|nr:peptidase S14 [Croceibacterium xixiisoli]MXO97910.1 peptidase S14 [Croceibacterium xixiisoli]